MDAKNSRLLLELREKIREKELLDSYSDIENQFDKDLLNESRRTSSVSGDNFIMKGKPETLETVKPNFYMKPEGSELPAISKSRDVYIDPDKITKSSLVTNADVPSLKGTDFIQEAEFKNITKTAPKMLKASGKAIGKQALKGLVGGALSLLDVENVGEGSDDVPRVTKLKSDPNELQALLRGEMLEPSADNKSVGSPYKTNTPKSILANLDNQNPNKVSEYNAVSDVQPELSPEEKLIAKMNEIEATKNKEIEDARSSDRKRALWANIVSGLGNIGGAQIQRESGANANLQKFQPIDVENTSKQVISDRDRMLKNLMDQYKIQNQRGNKDALTAAQIDLLKAKKSALDRKPAEKTTFAKELERNQAKELAKTNEQLQTSAATISRIDDAFKTFDEYSKKSITGTGFVPTLGGLTKYTSKETEALDSKFKNIAVKNLISEFQGMSKMADSGVERKAIDATNASVTTDDLSNYQILLGQKSIATKMREIAKAKQQWYNDKGNLDKFTHPLLEGTADTIIDKNGNMVIVDSSKKSDLMKKGYRSVDDYAKYMEKRTSVNQKASENKNLAVGNKQFNVGQVITVKGKNYIIKNEKGDLEEVK